MVEINRSKKGYKHSFNNISQAFIYFSKSSYHYLWQSSSFLTFWSLVGVSWILLMKTQKNSSIIILIEFLLMYPLSLLSPLSFYGHICTILLLQWWWWKKQRGLKVTKIDQNTWWQIVIQFIVMIANRYDGWWTWWPIFMMTNLIKILESLLRP